MYVFADRDWTGAPFFLGAVLLAAAATALLLVSFGAGPADRAGLAPAAPAGAGPVPKIAIRDEVAGRPFEVAGAGFTVDADPRARWARSVSAHPARPGERWVLAAVAVVNRARHHFNPGLLSYLARGPGGALYAPVRAGIAGPAGLGQAGGLPVGAGAEERLLFSLPRSLRHPVLAIQPAPTQPLEIRVPLREGSG